jgi:membrane protein YdbS with pleckstrin-like domain
MSNEVAQGAANTGVRSWPLASILTIVFVVLKLTAVIDWSWWWVLSPLWISAAFTIAILLIIFVILVIVYMFTDE